MCIGTIREHFNSEGKDPDAKHSLISLLRIGERGRACVLHGNDEIVSSILLLDLRFIVLVAISVGVVSNNLEECGVEVALNGCAVVLHFESIR